jgi:hypothetical protein
MRILRFARLRTVLTFVVRLYFLRVPVIAWLILLLAAPLGQAKAYAFFSGLLYVPDVGQFLLLSFVAFLLAASCLGSFNLIRAGAEERFHFRIPFGGDYVYLAITHIAPLVFLITVARLTRLHSGNTVSVWTGQWLAGFAGYVLAFLVILTSRALQLLFTPSAGVPPMSLFLPGGKLLAIGQAFLAKDPRWIGPLRSVFESAGALVQSAAFPLFQEGYDDKPPLGIGAGHIYAACMAVLSFLAYAGLGTLRQWQIEPASLGKISGALAHAANLIINRADLPALAWVLFFFTMAVWVLSGITYCIDRWRIPLFGFIILAIVVTGGNPKTDHYYRSCPRVQTTEARAE